MVMVYGYGLVRVVFVMQLQFTAAVPPASPSNIDLILNSFIRSIVVSFVPPSGQDNISISYGRIFMKFGTRSGKTATSYYPRRVIERVARTYLVFEDDAGQDSEAGVDPEQLEGEMEREVDEPEACVVREGEQQRGVEVGRQDGHLVGGQKTNITRAAPQQLKAGC